MIPAAYLQLRLADVLGLHDRDHRPGRAVSVTRVTRALRALDHQIAARDAASAAEQRRWLAQQIESLTTSLPPRRRARRKAGP